VRGGGSQGPGAMTAIPDVSGTSVTAATTALVAAELVVSATPLEEFDLVLPEGIVKGTSPGSGETVDKGTEVTLIVSLGPTPSASPLWQEKRSLAPRRCWKSSISSSV